jgi:hypothetical protein
MAGNCKVKTLQQSDWLKAVSYNYIKQKGKAIPVTGREGP